MRLLLDEVVSKNYSSKKASTVEEWKELVMEPLPRSEGSFTGNIVIVINVLGESGIESTRTAILWILATHDTELPANIRILLTSQPLTDIGEALNTRSNVESYIVLLCYHLHSTDPQLCVRMPLYIL